MTFPLGFSLFAMQPINVLNFWGVAMAHWWKRSSPNVSLVWFSDKASCRGWNCCWFSTLLREFLWIPWCSMDKQITCLYIYTFPQCMYNQRFFFCLFGDEATRGMDFQRSPAFNDHLSTCSPNRRAACALLGLKNYPEPFAGFSRITRATSLPAETHEIYLWQVY